MDVKSAFLNADLKEEVYVCQPSGFAIAVQEEKVYHLSQAPRTWNVKLDVMLKEMGSQQSEHEATVYRRGSGGTVLLVGVYIDDLIITNIEEMEVEAGIEVRQDASDISLCQMHYAKRILELGGLDSYNLAHSLMEKELKLSRQSTAGGGRSNALPMDHRQPVPPGAHPVGLGVCRQLSELVHGAVHGGALASCQVDYALRGGHPRLWSALRKGPRHGTLHWLLRQRHCR
jgi:hypothetical protein